MERESAPFKKKLLIVTDCFIPRWDGVARFLTEVIPVLIQDYDITVIAPDFKGDVADLDGITTVRIPLSKWQVGDFPIPKFDKDTIRKYVEETDLIWSQTLASIGGNTIKIATKLGKPVIPYIHSIEWELVAKSMSRLNLLRKPFRLIAKYAAKRLYNKCTHIMVPSEEVQELFFYNHIKTPSTVVHLGTNTDIFKPPEDKKVAKEQLGISGDTIVIGFVGRLAREKDLLTLYRAFIRLQKEHDNIKLLVVGGGSSEFEDHLKARPGVILAGSQNNVVPYYQAMDIYVLPSLLETTSLTTLEAMSCGVVPVCTPVGYIKKYIKEKHNGVLFPKKNALVLSLKLSWLIKEKYVREKMGKLARKTVEKYFSWNGTIEKIKKVLDKI